MLAGTATFLRVWLLYIMAGIYFSLHPSLISVWIVYDPSAGRILTTRNGFTGPHLKGKKG